MKKTAYLMLLALSAGLLAANAQTTDTNAPAQAADTTNTMAPAPADTNQPAAAPTAAPAPAPAVVDTNTAPTDSSGAATGASSAPGAATAGNIPVIQFSDIAITTAIESLAREGGINYVLDPKIGYGLPDANGQPKPEPTLSIRWENITPMNALLALLDNYGLQLIVDKHTGIDRITMKDPAAPPPLITRVIQLQYASVSNMVDSVSSVFGDKRSRVIGDRRTSQLVVVATDPEQAAVDILVAQLDKPTRQVLIETKLIEISSQPQTEKGVDWSGTLQAQNVSFGNGFINAANSLTTVTTPSSAGSTPGGGFPVGGGSSASTVLQLIQGSGGFAASTASGLIPSTGFLNADGVKAVLSFLNSSSDAQIMSTPRIVTLDNETAHLEVSRQYPVINFGGGTANNSGSSSITYSNVGTILDVTPRISANNTVWLKVQPEVSSHFGDINITIPGGAASVSTTFPVPIFDVRRLSTQVLIPNGDTLVMGGLVQDNPSASYTKVPVLGDIPALGWAFRSESKSMSKDNLVIFLTPTIVQDSDYQPSPTDFLQTQPTYMKSPMNPHTWWDSAQPRGNWSNPEPPIPGEFDSTSKLNNF